jgi:hypothetical protein
MMTRVDIEQDLNVIFAEYQTSFNRKAYHGGDDVHDLLMDVFGITPELKRENRQYWGRELGMCWQRIVVQVFQSTREDYSPALRVGADEPCDLIVGSLAIDTKYRIGSGDSGTLKKFKRYGPLLKEMGYTPILLIVREDNLKAAITACTVGGWEILIGDRTFSFIGEQTGFNIKGYLERRASSYKVVR